jgi:hypothetical protein
MGPVLDLFDAGSPARKDAMSKLIRPMPRTINTLVDPRSTGAPPGPRLPDILGLRGTKKL